MMIIRDTFIGVLLGMFGYLSVACAANSCANLDTFGSYDQHPSRENSFGIGGVGTFRIEGEADENKQPNFNLAFIDCDTQNDDMGRAKGLECKLKQVVTWATNAKPDPDSPNCSIDLDTASYSMKELQKGILVGR
jgi:hypothetical protein